MFSYCNEITSQSVKKVISRPIVDQNNDHRIAPKSSSHDSNSICYGNRINARKRFKLNISYLSMALKQFACGKLL